MCAEQCLLQSKHAGCATKMFQPNGRLFSDKSSEQGWPRRISDPLDIPVRPDDNLSSLVCKYITRVKSLQIASVDLKAFKRSVRSSLKRSKETTGEVGVSPNILRERPRSKVARTLFTSIKNNTTL